MSEKHLGTIPQKRGNSNCREGSCDIIESSRTASTGTLRPDCYVKYTPCVNTVNNIKLYLTGRLHAIPNDETPSVKEAVQLHAKPAKKNGVFSEKCVYMYNMCCVVEM